MVLSSPGQFDHASSMGISDTKSKKSDEIHLEELVVQDNRSLLSYKQGISAYFTILASACGLLSDGYQNSLMTMSNVVFRRLYPQEYTSTVSTRVSNALLIGDIVGMLLVGLICDRVSRKTALVGTTLIIVLGATLGTVAHGSRSSITGLFWFLTFARGITGVGVGGEYPASSTSASEAADESMAAFRGPVLVVVTNFVLSLGGPLAVSVFLIVFSAAGENHLPTVWRVCFGFGIILPITVLFFRLRMLTSKLFRRGAIKRKVPYWLTLKRYWKALIGTCGSWFIFDFVIYPNNIFSASIISSIIPDGDLKRTAEWQLLLGTIALPGAILGVFLCNILGRRNTMMLGFAGYIVFGLTIGRVPSITRITPLFIVFYGLMASFGNLGPGDMTIVVSAESYATPVRGSLFGLSAAFGKAGAVIGTQVFVPIQNNLGKRWTFIIAAICGLSGILVTYLFVPEMTGKDFEDEDKSFIAYLKENDWDGKVGEEEEIIVEVSKDT
ncbi:hypothetical protein M422DRAFT_780883 [Sphaerobolus stellatus SS14]|uniref:Major facilitator superfamily (MFS) profile domain-containing protein n=1 Tax=Sphaerobolus stellatus (strain SS14) TaxID=990650 RepID=A0A0C9UYB4_SPHS4|nr:hypothetical protein M422DRAFT_780883 [Sphaerobolus stellatus SS14]